jgi:hypothetical protein
MPPHQRRLSGEIPDPDRSAPSPDGQALPVGGEIQGHHGEEVFSVLLEIHEMPNAACRSLDYSDSAIPNTVAPYGNEVTWARYGHSENRSTLFTPHRPA